MSRNSKTQNKCPLCTKLFSDPVSHLTSVHLKSTKFERWQCGHCDFNSPSFEVFAAHCFETTHNGGEGSVELSQMLVDDALITLADMQAGSSAAHPNLPTLTFTAKEEPFCVKQEMSSPTSSPPPRQESPAHISMQQRKGSVIVTDPLRCPFCGSCFGGADIFRRHSALCRKRPTLTCPAQGCDKTFRSQIKLAYHIKCATSLAHAEFKLKK